MYILNVLDVILDKIILKESKKPVPMLRCDVQFWQSLNLIVRLGLIYCMQMCVFYLALRLPLINN